MLATDYGRPLDTGRLGVRPGHPDLASDWHPSQVVRSIVATVLDDPAYPPEPLPTRRHHPRPRREAPATSRNGRTAATLETINDT